MNNKTNCKKVKNILIRNLLVLLCLITYSIILHLFNITCPWLFLFNIPCPTCGVTRALVCIIKGSFVNSIKYNPMAIPLTIALFMQVNKCFVNKKTKNILDIISIFIVLLNFAFYLFGLIYK